MRHIAIDRLPGNVENHEASDDALQDPADFATRAAQSAFGVTYAPPALSGWRDRSPEEVRADRETSLARGGKR